MPLPKCSLYAMPKQKFLTLYVAKLAMKNHQHLLLLPIVEPIPVISIHFSAQRDVIEGETYAWINIE